jgi:uncharacterized membrane protein (DUF2068 family)
MKERPTGVTVIAVLQAIGGILSLFGGLALLGLGGLGAVAGEAGAGGLAAALGGLTLILGLASLVLAYGMWNLLEWAWLGTLVVQGLSIVLGLFSLVTGGSPNYIGIIINIAIIVYLMQPQIKGVFGRA